jgi:hypothetical protein
MMNGTPSTTAVSWVATPTASKDGAPAHAPSVANRKTQSLEAITPLPDPDRTVL